MKKVIEPCYYGDYLQLDSLLSSQQPVSGKYKSEAHDEMLFIIVHQVYEIWFKQILHELGSVLEIFKSDDVTHNDLSLAVHRLERVISIQKLLNQQIEVMETMTPQDFLEFRNYLVPASGFQSIQFKRLEITLGLKSEFRIDFDKQSFYSRLNENDRTHLMALENEKSLFELVNGWLERMPFLNVDDFSFWQQYENATKQMLDEEFSIINDNELITEKEKIFQLNEHQKTRESFVALFNADKYNAIKDSGEVRLSQQAILAAIFISLYREEPIFNIPFKFIACLTDIDENLTIWRYKHMMMVQRMIGKKIGTGGSSGHDYLRRTTEKNRIFTDFFNLSTYLIPKVARPTLPTAILQAFNFQKVQKK